MKIGSERYISVTSIKLYFVEIMCFIFPAYHCIVGCYAIPYPANIGKVKPFQKLIEKQAFHLLKNLGSHVNSYKDVEHGKRFYHTIIYFGLPGQSSNVSKAKDQDKFNSYIWWWKHCTTFEEKWLAKFYMEAMYDTEYDYAQTRRIWLVSERQKYSSNLLCWRTSLTKRKTRKLVNRLKYAKKSDVPDDCDVGDDDDGYIPRKKRPKFCFIS